jgi:hypothetical protein
VATDGGVSVIKDDGSVVDITGNLGGSEAKDFWINFDLDGNLFYGDRGDSTKAFYPVGFTSIPSSDVSTSSNDISYKTTSSGATLPKGPHVLGTSVDMAGNSVGGAFGLTNLDHNYSNVPDSMVSYITSDYNTGWMNGDIKLAALSDTDDTDVTGSELVTNGDFSNGTTGWTAEKGATLSIDSGRLKISGGTTNYPAASQSITTVVGKTYVVEVTIQIDAASTAIIPTIAGATIGGWFSSVGTETRSFTLVATSTSTKFLAQLGSDDNKYAYIDNISVRLAEPDRSVNGNGLAVHGTIQKNPVATGADLVAYFNNNYSEDNYLRQPVELLDYTGEWAILMWSPTSEFTFSVWDDEVVAQSYGNVPVSWWTSQGGNHYFRSNDLTDNVPAGMAPKFIAITHDSSGYKIYFDGQLYLQNSVTNTGITGGKVYLGCRPYSSVPSVGGSSNLALFRISATAPSASQIAKIYEDEKPLFQENAKATLYGTSDAVKALAYDDDTGLLHVGTNHGRSVFQGLRRVDNTTDAVGTAISASNDLVVEE